MEIHSLPVWVGWEVVDFSHLSLGIKNTYSLHVSSHLLQIHQYLPFLAVVVCGEHTSLIFVMGIYYIRNTVSFFFGHRETSSSSAFFADGNSVSEFSESPWVAFQLQLTVFGVYTHLISQQSSRLTVFL